MDKLDASHHKHLRTILGYQWPYYLISNKTLYKMYNTILLLWPDDDGSCLVSYVLQMREEPPPQAFAVIGSNDYWAWRDCHCTNLLQVDLQNARLGSLRSDNQVKKLRTLAKKRTVALNEGGLNAAVGFSKLLQSQNAVKRTLLINIKFFSLYTNHWANITLLISCM